MAYNPYINPYYGQQNFGNQMQMSQQQMIPTQMSVTNQDERIWVQSASAAENYLVAPNSFVRLWDSNRPVFYERRTDATGRPFPMETFEYKKMDSITNQMPMQAEITNTINDLKARVIALEGRIGGSYEQSNTNDPGISAV